MATRVIRRRGVLQLFEALLPFVFALVNHKRDDEPLPPELQSVRDELIRMLETILGEHLGPVFSEPRLFEVPLRFQLTQDEKGIRWIPAVAPGEAGWNLPGKETLYAAVAFLQTDEGFRSRLRRCDECSRFFLGKGAHRRRHSFCKEECRREFDRKHRDPVKQREYMRAYRDRKKRESVRRADKRRTSDAKKKP